MFNGRFGEELYKEAYAHIPQSTVADRTQTAALACFEEFGYDEDTLCYSRFIRNKPAYFVSENHDSLTIQAPASDWERYAKTLKGHMLQPIDFSIHCSLKRNYTLTIPVDVEVAENSLADFKKVKLDDTPIHPLANQEVSAL